MIVIGRWAGDQFTIVLPGVISTDAEKIAKRILSGVQASEISLTNGPALEIKLSAGIATSPDHQCLRRDRPVHPERRAWR